MAVPAYLIVLAAVAVLVAAGLGVVGGLVVSRSRARTRRAAETRPGPTVAELLARLVRRSHSGLVVLNRFGDIVLANERAETLGVVVGARPDARVAAAAALISEGGVTTEIDLSPSTTVRRAPQSVVARIHALGDGFVVVDASDASDAVRLEAVRRDFVANVGHELKTPVGAMAVLAEAVLDAEDPDEVAHFAGKIFHESRRLGSLVTELIELSRLQGAERLPEPIPTDVDDVIDQAVGRARSSAETANTQLTLDGPSGLAAAGSRPLLITALANLLENAIAYSPAGSTVSVRRRRAAERIEISVTDRGIGIAPEHQERVFERFFRVDQARSRATGGTGLGLAIVKHVAANHGGDVRLWSEPGVGSTFTLRIPAAPETSREAPTPAAPPAAARPPTPPAATPRPALPRPPAASPAASPATASSSATVGRDHAAALPGSPGGSP